MHVGAPASVDRRDQPAAPFAWQERPGPRRLTLLLLPRYGSRCASGARPPRGCRGPGLGPRGERPVKLSARNQLAGTVKNVSEGAAIANVELDVNGQRLVASITVEAARELGLTEGMAVTAIIKASDVTLAT